MRRSLALAGIACLAFGAAGCGGVNDSTPVACLEGERGYLRALEAAPVAVELGGSTPISTCLPENQSGAALAEVGEAMLSAATELNGEGRADPGGAAAVRVGYLVGAARRGGQATEGIHDELVRRLVAAARYRPEGRPLPPAFRTAYRRGYDAGLERG